MAPDVETVPCFRHPRKPAGYWSFSLFLVDHPEVLTIDLCDDCAEAFEDLAAEVVGDMIAMAKGGRAA